MSALGQKMKIEKAKSICFINAPNNYINELGPFPKEIEIKKSLHSNSDQIHLFVKSKMELETTYTKAEKTLNPDGMFWICYPKKSSGIKTDIDRDSGWKILSKSKLRPVAFISVDETWTAFGFRNETGIIKPKVKTTHENYIDSKNRIITVPEDLEKLFRKNKKAKEFFETLSFSNRKEYVVWILDAKRDETKLERLTKTIQKLLEGKKNPSEK